MDSFIFPDSIWVLRIWIGFIIEPRRLRLMGSLYPFILLLMKSNDYSVTSFEWQALPRPFSVLAPMIDVTDTCFRRLVKAWSMPDVLFSEFVSADTWCNQSDVSSLCPWQSLLILGDQPDIARQ